MFAIIIGMLMDLFELANCYASFGDHRTGSKTQLSTEGWLFTYLTQTAKSVNYFSFDYLHFDAETSLRLNRRLIPSMPMYYQAEGEYRDKSKIATATVEVTPNEGIAFKTIQSLAQQAERNSHDALVVATHCANDSLYAFNVIPTLINTIPVVLVPGTEYECLDQEELRLDYAARVCQRSANNIVGLFGSVGIKAPIVITTPITGWFECAGERGTGIALAISLAQEISQHHPVELVLASGHELGYLGGFNYVDGLSDSPAAVIHLGSSLATLNSSLEAWSNLDSIGCERLEDVLLEDGIPLHRIKNPSRSDDWVGEAECWAKFNCPKLSVAGNHPLFHTPEDRIQFATCIDSLTKTHRLLTRLSEIVLHRVDIG